MAKEKYTDKVYKIMNGVYGDKFTLSQEEFESKIDTSDEYQNKIYGIMQGVYGDKFTLPIEEFTSKVKKKVQTQQSQEEAITEDSSTVAEPLQESGGEIDFNAVKYGIKPKTKQQEEVPQAEGAMASFAPPSPLQLRRGETEVDYQIRKNKDLVSEKIKSTEEQLNSIAIGFDEANKNIERLNSISSELASIKPPQGIPTSSEIKSLQSNYSKISSELNKENENVDNKYSPLFKELESVEKNENGEYIIEDEKKLKRIQSQLDAYNKDVQPILEKQKLSEDLFKKQEEAVNKYNEWFSQNYPTEKANQAKEMFDSYKLYKTVEQEAKDKEKALSIELAKLQQSNFTLDAQAQAISDKKIGDFQREVIQNLPITEQVGAYLFGGVKKGAEGILGSVATSLSREVGVTQEEIDRAETPEAKKILQEARAKILEERKSIYEWGGKMYDKSKKTSVDYGLVESLKEVEDPLDMLSFAITSVGEQAPQLPLAITTFGGSTYFQELGSMQQQIVQELMAKGMSLDEALNSEEANKTATNLTALGIASLDMLGLVSQFGGKAILGDVIKKEIKANAVDKIVLGTVGELVTETGQEFIGAGGTSQALGKGFVEGVMSVDADEIKDLWGKVLFSASSFTAVSTFIEEGKVNADNVEMLNASIKDNEIYKNLRNQIQTLEASGAITPEVAKERLAQLDANLAANMKIPENIQGEKRAKLIELQTELDKVEANQKEASDVFKVLYEGDIANIKNKMTEVINEESQATPLQKGKRTTVEQYGDKKEVTLKKDFEAKEAEIKRRRQEELSILDAKQAESEKTGEIPTDENGNAIRIKEEKQKIKSKYDAELAALEKSQATLKKDLEFDEQELASFEQDLKNRKEQSKRDKQKPKEEQPVQRKLVTVSEMIGEPVVDKDSGKEGTIELEGEIGRPIFVSTDGTLIKELGSPENAETAAILDFGLDIKQDKDFSKAKNISKKGITVEQQQKTPLDQLEKIAEKERKSAEMEAERILNDAIEKVAKKTEMLLVKVGNREFLVSKDKKGNYKIWNESNMGEKSPQMRAQAEAAFETKTKQIERDVLSSAEKRIERVNKKEKDNVEKAIEKAINFVEGDKTTLKSSVIGIPQFMLAQSLKIVLASYKAGKSLANAVKKGYDYLKSQGYNISELDYREEVLNQIKGNTKRNESEPVQPKEKFTENEQKEKANKETKEEVTSKQKPSSGAKKPQEKQETATTATAEQKSKQLKEGIKEKVDEKKKYDKKASEAKKAKGLEHTPSPIVSNKGVVQAISDFIKSKVYSYEKTGEKDIFGRDKRKKVTNEYSAKQFKEDVKEFGFNDEEIRDLFIVANPEVKNINKKRTNAAKNIDRNKLGGLGISLKNIIKVPPQFMSLELFDEYYDALNWLGQRTSNFDSKEFSEIKDTLKKVAAYADYEMGMYNDISEALKEAKTKEEYLESLKKMLDDGEINQSQYNFLSKNKPRTKAEPKEKVEWKNIDKPKKLNTVGMSEKEREKVRVVESVSKEDYELMPDNLANYYVNVLASLNEDFIPSSVYDLAGKIQALRTANKMEASVKERGGITLNKIRDIFIKNLSEKTEKRTKRASGETIDSSVGLRGSAFRDGTRPMAINYGKYKEKIDNIRKEMSVLMASFGVRSKKAKEADIKVMMFRIQRQKDANKNSPETNSVKEFIEEMFASEKSKNVLEERYGKPWLKTVQDIYDEFKDQNGELNKEKLYASLSDKEKKLLSLSDKLVKNSERFAVDAAAEHGIALELIAQYAHVPTIVQAMDLKSQEDLVDTVAKMISGTSNSRLSTKSGTLEGRKKAVPIISFSNYESVVNGLDKTYKDYFLTDALKTENRAFRMLNEMLKDNKEGEKVARGISRGVTDTRNALLMNDYKKSIENPLISFLVGNASTAILGTSEKLIKEFGTNPAFQLLRYALKGDVGKIPKLFYYMTSETLPSVRGVAKLSDKLMNNVIIALSPAQINRYLQGQKFSGEQLDLEQDMETFSPYQKDISQKLVKAAQIYRRKTGLKRLGEYMTSGNDQVMSRSIFRIEFEEQFKKLTGVKLTEDDYKKIANKNPDFYDKYSEQLSEAVSRADEEVSVGFTTTNEAQRSYDQLTAGQRGLFGKMKFFMQPFQIAEYQNLRRAIYNEGAKGIATTVIPILARQALYNYLSMTLPAVMATGFGALMGDEDDKEDLMKLELYLNKDRAIKSLVSAVTGMFIFRDMSNYVRLPFIAGVELLNAMFGDEVGLREEDEDYNKYQDQLFYNAINLNPDDYSSTIGTVTGTTKAFVPSFSPMLDVVEPTLKSETVQRMYKDEFDIKEDKYDEIDYHGVKAGLKLGIANGILPADAYKAYTYYFNKDVIKGNSVSSKQKNKIR